MNLPAIALLGASAFAMRFLTRRLPWVGIAVGLGFWGLVAWMVQSFEPSSFQTEGSPAGAIIAVVYLGLGMGAVIAGLYMIAASIRTLRGTRPEPISRVASARLARGLPAHSTLPDDIESCRIWITSEACARGAARHAQALDARSRRPILVAQDARYLDLLQAALTTPLPLLAQRDFHVNRVRDLAAGVAQVELLLVGLSSDPRNEAVVLPMLTRQPGQFTVQRCLSLDDLHRAGVHVGRARTAAAALHLPVDAPLKDPMVLEALASALREARRA